MQQPQQNYYNYAPPPPPGQQQMQPPQMQQPYVQQQQPQMQQSYVQQPPQMLQPQYQQQQQQQQQQQHHHQQPQMQQQQQPRFQQPPMQQQPGMQQQPQMQQPARPPPQPPQAQQKKQQQARQPRSQMSRPPYIDPDTNIIYDTDNVEHEGFLTKQSMWLKDWRRRYFLLKGSKLFYCSNEYSTPHGMIDLAVCNSVQSADLKSRKRNSFEISTREITYLLYADTEREKDDWIGWLGRAIVRSSSSYYTQSASGSGVQRRDGGGSGRSQPQAGPYGGVYAGQHQGPRQSAMDSDDDDIYYEDPNNPNPYFND
mmetsp:Transcript_25649/g.54796  ORF Transcript_25649/g.54796 Transcript_25649/m.54796 type:complete len:312 (+) Transcript_25649:242-1177(+)